MIQTGETFINWESFKECSDIKKVVMIENGKEILMGSTTEKVTFDRENDLLYRKQELIFLDPNTTNRTINLVIKRSTFEPISCTDEGQMNVSVHYEHSKKEIIMESDNEKRFEAHPLEEGVFDLFSVELLLRLLPIEPGYYNELRAFNHMVHDSITVRIKVLGEEYISDGNHEIDSWKIDVYFGDNLQTYWISKETNELLKQSIKLGENKYFDFIR